MTRRLESGPLLVTVGALLLLVSLFLTWYSGQLELTAWDVFEVWDLVLAALAVAAVTASVGLLAPEAAVIDQRWLPGLVLAALVVVAVEIVDPPPAALGADPATGAWLAFGGAVLMGVGAVLTFSRVRLAFTVEGRDPRRHVSAVDARGEAGPATAEAPAGPGAPAPASAAAEPGGGGLFGRTRRASSTSAAEPPTGAATPEATGAVRAEDEEPLVRSRARRRQRASESGENAEKDPG
jgi:hypothetical protein